MFRLMFFEPRIPPNTGNAIRTSAATGCELHLVEPLGFDLSDAKLRRAGLDYHDLAHVSVHRDLAARARRARRPLSRRGSRARLLHLSFRRRVL